MVTVLTAGHVNWDVTLRVDRFPEPDGEASIRSQRQSGGGSAANVATALAGLEVETGLVGSVGDDENGLLAKRDLEDAGVSVDGLRIVEDAATSVKYLLVTESGAVSVLGNDGVNEAIRAADVNPERIESADHVHLTGQRPKTAAEIARVATRSGSTVSFDPGRRLGDREYGETLALSDIIFANDREIDAMVDADEDVTEFTEGTVVAKHGEDGGEVHTPSESFVHSGFEIDSVDTSGAGDAFAAGFLASTLRTDDAEAALEYANACGALAASRKGPRSVPTIDAVDRFLESRG
ncbi:PfkB family carbohydrate kinase [Halostagnicola sp. A-GB9-2]|uniref:carbohydrate kinase family protein n=1 Tax=Halostagnicola sp. A-GB9-2 TaxID=3048066 RepID=UPI0024BF30D8|nr:PfkB family carbohydrate kinase [Halostagnicola sp. A-GB9-2]MDJ1431193.1 PfkB family carbohydrate kinase [Halostagnicola sp. A-GB9-2]